MILTNQIILYKNFSYESVWEKINLLHHCHLQTKTLADLNHPHRGHSKHQFVEETQQTPRTQWNDLNWGKQPSVLNKQNTYFKEKKDAGLIWIMGAIECRLIEHGGLLKWNVLDWTNKGAVWLLFKQFSSDGAISLPSEKWRPYRSN